MNLVALSLGMIDRPGQAMKAATEKPRSWLIPAILIVLSTVVLLYVSQPYAMKLADEQQQMMIERMAAQMSEEQMAQVRANVKPMTPQTYWLAGLGGALVIAALGWAARGGVAHFTSMAMGGQSTWGPTYAVGVWSMIPYAVRSLLMTVYVLVNKGVMAHSGLSFLVAAEDTMKNARNWQYLALSLVDPFVLWHIILFGIGLVAATKLSKGKATFLAFIIWLGFAALQLTPSLISMAFMGGGN